jgi:hypothetical protein
MSRRKAIVARGRAKGRASRAIAATASQSTSPSGPSQETSNQHQIILRASTSHLLNLPLDLYREILKYLIIKEIGVLDLALCNHQLREIFLSGLSETVLARLDDIHLTNLHIPWLIQRNILTKEFKISDSMDIKICGLIIQSKPCLEILNLVSTNIQDADLRQIGSCPLLKSMYFYLNYNITARGLEDFLRVNPQLVSLSISNNSHFSNELLSFILDTCPHLQHLDLSRCSWVTDASLDLIGKSSLKLKSLDIHLCHVSDSQVRELIKRSSFSSISLR